MTATASPPPTTPPSPCLNSGIHPVYQHFPADIGICLAPCCLSPGQYCRKVRTSQHTSPSSPLLGGTTGSKRISKLPPTTRLIFFWFFFWVVTLVVSSSQHVLFKERNKAIFCARPKKKKKKTKNQISLPAFTGTDVTRSCQAHDHADWPITLSSINLSITHYPSSHLPLEILSPCLCRSCCD